MRDDQGQCIDMVMPRPTKSQIFKKVISHLRKDIKEEKRGAREDEELEGEINQKKAHEKLKSNLLKKGTITKDQLRQGKKRKK